VASTGNVFAGTGENLAGIGATAWTNPGNIVSDNATDATNNGSSSNYLVARNYGLSVPVGATVVGITVRIELSEHSPGAETLNARLQDENGALIGSGKTASVTGTTKTVYTYGSTSDLWGATLTPAIVNDADFGVRFWFTTSHDIRVDYVTLAVEYTEGTATLTGAASTSQAGTATPDTSKAATGESGTTSAGSVTQSGQAPLVGSAITSSQGELVRSRGLQIDSAQGSVTPTTALSGSEITSEAGSVSVDTVGFNESLTGSDTTAAQGSPNLGASVRVHSRKVGGGSASRSLSGNAGAVSIGAVTPVPTKTPTSIAALLSAGSVGKDRFKAMTGLAVTSTAGTLTSAANVAFALTGPTSGITGVADTYYVTPSAPITGGGATIDITASGATLSTSTLTFAAGATAAQSFTVTRATDGTTSVSIGTTTPGMSVTGTPISYTTQASTDPAWTGVPVITFPQGTAAIHDLTQYTDNFDAFLYEMQMAEGSNALPTGVTLNSAGSLAYNGTSPEATIVNVQIDIEDKLQTYTQRIASVGASLVRTFSFADPAHLGAGPGGAGYNYNYGWYDDGGDNGSGNDHPVYDAVVFPPGGGGSLRFEMTAGPVPVHKGGGSWTTNFSNDLQTRFNLGDEFFCQWRQRFDANYIGPNADGNYAARKQCLVSSGDTAYEVWNPATHTGVAGSCRPIELCVQSYVIGASTDSYNDLFPIAYTRCPDWGGTINLTPSDPDQFLLLQNMMGAPYCGYNNVNNNGNGTNLPTGNCFTYVANEWMTFQVGITVGPTAVGSGNSRTVPNTRFRVWGQRQGQPSVPLIDVTTTMSFPELDPGYGKFWFTQYNASLRNNTWQTWVSELIIATQRIPDAL
jgi:hypothetical protein